MKNAPASGNPSTGACLQNSCRLADFAITNAATPSESVSGSTPYRGQLSFNVVLRTRNGMPLKDAKDEKPIFPELGTATLHSCPGD
jgi:hypothetical protein